VRPAIYLALALLAAALAWVAAGWVARWYDNLIDPWYRGEEYYG
jgi:hypothetical protein